jgi:hypothetical protein
MAFGIDPNFLIAIVGWGQFASIVLAIILGIYLDDCREIGRQPKGINRKSRPFDWIVSSDVILPSVCAIVFLSFGASTLGRANELKYRLNRFDIYSAVQDGLSKIPIPIEKISKAK